MTPERWQQIQDLFRAALDRDPGERAAFLDQACAGNPSLRAEVERLIASDEQAASFLEQAVQAGVQMVTEDRGGSIVGQRIGPYLIKRELGHGGMSAVYLAVRADDQYQKRVAIKLIKRGMDTEDILRRFRNERQILAGLDHPNIAKLLDGGTTEDGLPYFVIEYIEGVPINEYGDSHKLSTVERLKLFRTVCSAVHYAHQNLVVHRDLKPGNILVTSDGAPKLLDFGIAKLLNPELSPQTIDPTAIGLRLMTPAYASPEQIQGKTITTASDVYSLGVLLYELLTGHRPYRVENWQPQEIERIICETEPERPSTAISRVEEVLASDGKTRIKLTPELVSRTRDGQPEKLRRRLSGDLDTIVLMAMRKEPPRRYASVEQLSEDIRRHLIGLPVIARKGTFSYRAGKFVRRHRVVVAFLVLIVGFAITMTVQSARIARERDRAASERDKAERVNAFLQEMLASVDPRKKGREITVAAVLDEAARRVETELIDQPEIEASVRTTIGTTYQSLGLYDAAETHLRRALAIRQKLFGEEHPHVAESMHNLGLLLTDMSKYQKAEPLLDEALVMRRKLRGPEHPDIAQSLNSLGVLLRTKSEYQEAEDRFREALVMRRKLLGPEHLDVAQSLNNLASVLWAQGKLKEAESLYREALAMNRKRLGLEHPDVATNLNNLANVLYDNGDYNEAESLHREALAMNRKRLGPEHPDVAGSLHNLAVVLHAKGNYNEAESMFREALVMRRKLLGPEHLDVATTMNNLARLLHAKGEYEEAELLLREALAVHRKLLGTQHEEVITIMNDLAWLLHAKGEDQEAESLFRQILELRRTTRPPGHLDIANALIELGMLLTETGASQRAEPLLRESLDIRRQALPEGDWRTASAESALGKCLTQLQRYAEAEPLLANSFSILKTKRGPEDALTLETLTQLIDLYQAWGKPNKATQYQTLLP
jgi:serine/threonine-protein kinase